MAKVSGTLGKETFKQLMEESERTFLPTENYRHIQCKLEEFGHVTICGASGQGKTTIALMLARDYEKKGYESVFVHAINDFDLRECISSSHSQILIVDDVFGSVGLPADFSKIRTFLQSLKYHFQGYKSVTYEVYSREEGSKRTGQSLLESVDQRNVENADRHIRVIFTSRTYNFNAGMSKLNKQTLTVLTGETVVDLSTEHYRYSDEERFSIYQHYKSIYKQHETVSSDTSAEELSKQELHDLQTAVVGFPLTCKLLFQIEVFRQNSKDFVKRPLFHLRRALNTMLSLNNNESAVLILMLLCDNKLDLLSIESQGRDERMDEMFECVTNIVPTASRTGTAAAARDLRGSFFSGGNTVRFSHSSIYDACTCVIFHFHPTFVLSNCSYDFLFQRVKPGSNIDTKLIDHLHFIFVPACYHVLIASRLANGMRQGRFSVTVTHPMLKNELFVQLLLQDLHADVNNVQWVHQKEKRKGLLYWAVQGHSSLFCRKIEDTINDRFTYDEISEALNACVENNNLSYFRFCLFKYEPSTIVSMKRQLLLSIPEYGSWEIAEYLFKEGTDIKFSDNNRQNFIHFICKFGAAEILRSLQRQIGSLVKERDYLLAIHSSDINGRTPAMLAVLNDSMDCFQLCKISNRDVRDRFNQNILHLACITGNKNIVQQVLTLTPSNINSRGRHGWTPIMYAAVTGQLSLFDSLYSNTPDLTVVSHGGNNLLHLASQGGNKSIVQKVLTPSNINQREMHGLTPVMYAALKGHGEVFEFLLSNNADLTQLDFCGNSLLHLACRGGCKDIVQHVVTSSNVNNKGGHGWTPIMAAAAHGHSGVFQFLVASHADLTVVDDAGNALVHLASQGGSQSIVEHVLTAANVNSRGMNGWTPIMYSAVNGHRILFDILASNKADLTQTDEAGNNLLHLATHGGNRDIVQLVLTSSDINSRGLNGLTPVMYAALKGNTAVLDVLMSHNADQNLVDRSGNNLLHFACQGGYMTLVQRFLTTFNVNSRGVNGWTPILFSAVYGHGNIFNFLMSNNADLTLLDNTGNDVLHLACQGGNTYIVHHVLTPSNINKRGMHGWTPVMHSAVFGHLEVFDILVSNKADLTLLDGDGNSLLHLACQGGNKDIIQHLLTPFNINSRGQYDRTPVMIAAIAGHKHVFSLLVSHNADLTLVDTFSDSLLHLACQGGNWGIVQNILTKSNINSRGMHNMTPLMKAAAFGHKGIVQLLLDNGADLSLVDVDGDDVVCYAQLGNKPQMVEYLKSLLHKPSVR